MGELCGNTDNTFGYACECPKGHSGLRHKNLTHNYAWEREGPVWSIRETSIRRTLMDARGLK